jgi:ADP-dependent NAD(P)H-hydrate dehydratase / NAD(P)H-hydrate epimerase
MKSGLTHSLKILGNQKARPLKSNTAAMADTFVGAEILTPAQMYRADALAIEGGMSSIALMENAGKAAAKEITKRFKKSRTAVLCGPGNNGGDGLVIARLLKGLRWPVEVFLWGERAGYTGDAAVMAAKWKGITSDLSDFVTAELVIDALFGTGLARDFPEDLAGRINASGAPIVSIDIPSGLDGLTSRPRGACIKADATITFFRKKPAHVLYPGSEFCGEVFVADIGIPDQMLVDHSLTTIRENVPPELPRVLGNAHKYSRGSALIYSGDEFRTGASRLAAQAAARIGTGVVSICGPVDALRIHAAHLSSIMLKPCETVEALQILLGDNRIKSFCIGPASGHSDRTLEMVFCALDSSARVVLDADALTAIAAAPQLLFDAVHKSKSPAVVMTPHEGEFTRMFKEISELDENKIEKAMKAAKQSGAIVVFKGPDSVIAHPDGRAVVNANASSKLATAGSGDVLAGLITGLLAQGMDAFAAASAAVWLHGDAARRSTRRTIIAEDILDYLP